ncbi:hypothetical protein ACGFX2_16055 [Streptomyces goshikiensis]|uniref:hypothetical protein n=1 Tax=Streptomyces goshikiensis TaxID=1942 RepID=UPI003713B896
MSSPTTAAHYADPRTRRAAVALLPVPVRARAALSAATTRTGASARRRRSDLLADGRVIAWTELPSGETLYLGNDDPKQPDLRLPRAVTARLLPEWQAATTAGSAPAAARACCEVHPKRRQHPAQPAAHPAAALLAVSSVHASPSPDGRAVRGGLLKELADGVSFTSTVTAMAQSARP